MTPEQIEVRAREIAAMVQGSQILEGAGLDEAGYEKLIRFCITLLTKQVADREAKKESQ